MISLHVFTLIESFRLKPFKSFGAYLIIFQVEMINKYCVFAYLYRFLAPSRLANRVSYHLMREHRKPLWEDKENEK